MASSSISIYELIVKRLLLNNLVLPAVFAIGLLAASVQAATRPIFVVLTDGSNFLTEVSELERLGAHVYQRVPPRVLAAQLPESMPLPSRPSYQSVFTSVVSLPALEPLGPLAVAAGIDWNRQQLNESKVGSSQMAAMRVLLSQRNLSAPENVKAVQNPSDLSVTWSGVDGALYYHVQVDDDRSFGNPLIQTRTLKPNARLPLLFDLGPRRLYVRVRGIDHPEGDHEFEDDIYGSWSSPISVDVTPPSPGTAVPAPVLTSPLNASETEGFTVILEWTPNTPAELQVARDSNFRTMVFNVITDGGEYTLPGSALHVKDKLYWRVRLIGERTSEWSKTRNVTIGSPKSHVGDTFINPEAPR